MVSQDDNTAAMKFRKLSLVILAVSAITSNKYTASFVANCSKAMLYQISNDFTFINRIKVVCLFSYRSFPALKAENLHSTSMPIMFPSYMYQMIGYYDG